MAMRSSRYRDIQRTARDGHVFRAFDLGADEVGDLDAAPVNTQKGQIAGSFVLLHELTSHPRDGAMHRLFVHDRDVQRGAPGKGPIPS